MLVVASGPARPLERLLERTPPSADSVERFLGEHSFPLQDGTVTTFVYRGQAESVRLKLWIHGIEDRPPFRRIGACNLWHLSLELPEGSRIEYKLEVTSNGESSLLLDPLNPLLAHDPFGANSVCYGPGYTIPDWTLPDPAAAPGTIQRQSVKSTVFGHERQVSIYLPAGWERHRSLPILIAHDGRDYLRYSDLKTVLDNLIHRVELAPLIVALTDPDDRLREYAGDPGHAAFLVDELLPLLRQRFATAARPGPCGLMGASFGAVASLYTAWRYPRVFDRLLLQSGSFVVSRRAGRRRGPQFRPVVAFNQLFRVSPRRVSERVYLSCGLFESLAPHNRELVPLLEAAGMEVRYREVRDGHNWENWRDRLGEALGYLFPSRSGRSDR